MISQQVFCIPLVLLVVPFSWGSLNELDRTTVVEILRFFFAHKLLKVGSDEDEFEISAGKTNFNYVLENNIHLSDNMREMPKNCWRVSFERNKNGKPRGIICNQFSSLSIAFHVPLRKSERSCGEMTTQLFTRDGEVEAAHVSATKVQYQVIVFLSHLFVFFLAL